MTLASNRPAARHLVTALVLPFALAACQGINRPAPAPTAAGPVTPAPAPKLTPAPAPEAPKVANVQGRWQPYANGKRAYGYSEFKGNTYAAYPPDGKSTLAIGTYKATANGANITYYSAARGKDVNVNCRLANPTTMNCTTADGTNIQLRKA